MAFFIATAGISDGGFVLWSVTMLKIYGLTEDELDALRAVAIKKTGKNSLSYLAKTLLLEQIVSDHNIQTD